MRRKLGFVSCILMRTWKKYPSVSTFAVTPDAFSRMRGFQFLPGDTVFSRTGFPSPHNPAFHGTYRRPTVLVEMFRDTVLFICGWDGWKEADTLMPTYKSGAAVLGGLSLVKTRVTCYTGRVLEDDHLRSQMQLFLVSSGIRSQKINWETEGQ